MTTDNHSTSWVVCDPGLWPKLSEIRRGEIKAWLRLNQVDPLLVPVDSTVMIAEAQNGEWEIWFEEFLKDEYGDVRTAPDNPGEAYIRERTAPLAIDPPMHWLIPAVPPPAQD